MPGLCAELAALRRLQLLKPFHVAGTSGARFDGYRVPRDQLRIETLSSWPEALAGAWAPGAPP